MRHVLGCIAALCLCSVVVLAQSHAAARHNTTYDGNWWLAADRDTQSGFLEGAADCLTWVVHRKGFNGTSDELRGPITMYYKKNPSHRSMLVTEVWQELQRKQTRAANTQKEGGEVWTNPHWYLNGQWWNASPKDERKAFVEGYLWCVRSYSNSDEYPQSDDYYFDKVDKYTEAHPDTDNEPIAETLSRFRKRPSKKQPSQ